MIYGYVFDDDTTIRRNKRNESTRHWRDDGGQLPAWYGLIQACRRLHQETSLMAFATTTFVFKDLETFAAFCLKLTTVQRDLVNKIRLYISLPFDKRDPKVLVGNLHFHELLPGKVHVEIAGITCELMGVWEYHFAFRARIIAKDLVKKWLTRDGNTTLEWLHPGSK
jgi:hypothetical protein